MGSRTDGRRWPRRAWVLGIAGAVAPWPAFAQPPRPRPTPVVPATLHSSVLTLEVMPSGRYTLAERATGRVLVDHAETRLRLGDAEPEVRDLTEIQTTPTSLEARLGFSNTPRTARLRFAFTSPEVLQVDVTYDPGGLTNVTEVFTDQGERYYGLWEHPVEGVLDNRGADEEMLGFRHMAEVNYPSARAPFYVTSRGYGIYTQSEARGHYRIAVKGRTTVSFDDDHLRYFVLYGPSYLDVLRRYNALSGGSFVPPLWAFDAVWWRDDHHKDWDEYGVKSGQDLAVKDAEALQAHRIPGGSMWLDRVYATGRYGWGNMDFDGGFPDPAKMVRDLDALGFKLLLWTANRTANRIGEEGRRAGYVFSDEIYTDWPAADVRQPQAYEWFKAQLGAYAKVGIRGYKIDRGEEGEMPDAVQNRVLTLFQKLSKEGQDAVHPGDNLVFARNVYDTGRRYSGVWNGDTVSQWPGLVISVKHALRCGAIDMPVWGSDVGGYFRGTPTKELFARWLQFGAYSPLMEVKIGEHRTPWNHYDEELIRITREQASAHHDLIPYTRSAVQKAARTGLPVMRPLLFDHPEDETLLDLWDEYMFGPSILVAPVTADGLRERKVYLPAGRWMDYNERRAVFSGGTTITAAAPLDRLPLYVEEGAIVPRGDIVRTNNRWTPDWKPSLRVEVFAQREGRHTFEYFDGASVKTIACTVEGGRMTLEVADLETPGVLEIYVKEAGRVLRDGRTLSGPDAPAFDREGHVLRLPLRGAVTYAIEGMSSLF
jgi:alpha-D-xyloside xylohydrolase